MLESQIGKKGIFSHHANSSFGIPFFILDLHRETMRMSEWVRLFLTAPLHAFKTPPEEKIFVVEADTDRAGEGKFLAEFLRPEVVLLVSVSRTHGVNFDSLVRKDRNDRDRDKFFESVDEAIAYDYGYFLSYCSGLAVINGDLPLQVKQEERTRATVVRIEKKEYLDNYVIEGNHTKFVIKGKNYAFAGLLPEEIFYSVAMCRETLEYLEMPFDLKFEDFVLPPGRSSIFKGVRGMTIIDSSYNANLSSMKAILGMYENLGGGKKWVVLGDMLELGVKEQEEHEKLGEILADMKLEKIVLVGSRMNRFTKGALMKLLKNKDTVVSFQNAVEAGVYLTEHLKRDETVLFKGSQSILLEGLIAPLLENKRDMRNLSRRGEFWDMKRRKAGLPAGI